MRRLPFWRGAVMRPVRTSQEGLSEEAMSGLSSMILF
jgi:hypothetical protein